MALMCSKSPWPAAGGRRAGLPARILAVAAGAAVLATLAGCGVSQRLMLRDSAVNDAALLVTVRPAAWGRQQGPARGFEAGAQSYRAEGDHALSPNEFLTVGNQTINGPDTLHQKAKVVAWHFGFTDRFYFGPAFELDMSVGGLKLDVDYELRPQSGVIGAVPFARSHTLPYGAITPRHRFGPLLAIEARLAAAGLTHQANHERLDAAVVLSPSPQFSLRLGYAWQRTGIASWSDTLFDNIDVKIRARGPAASLRLDF